MIQLHKSLLSFATASAYTFIPSNPHVSSPIPLMAKLQCRAVQCSSNHFLPRSLFSISNSNKCQRCSQVKFRKSRICCMVTTHNAKAGQNFHLFSSIACKSKCDSSVHINSRHGFFSGVVPKYKLNYWLLDNSNWGCLTNNRTLGKRFFSHVQKASIKSDNVRVQDGEKGKCVPGFFQMFNKHKKRAKTLITYGKKKSENSISSASKNADIVPSGKQLAEDGTGELQGSLVSSSPIRNNIENSKVNGKKKKKSGRKKGNKQIAANSSEEPVGAKGSSNVSVANVDTCVNDSENSANNFEKSSDWSESSQVPDSSTSAKKQVKARGKSSKSATESQQKEKPQDIGTVKPMGRNAKKQLYPATGKSVVVVESVTKAKVIQGYLGDIFEVLPSYGHVRDLAARSGSVRPHDDFSMVWEVPSPAWTHLKSIKVALTGAENLILASDPDREGEAIAWHIIEMLHQQDALHDDITVSRVVFHEITEQSIKSALQAPRDIDVNLVHAYLARRALDYLIGFNISPLLWRKLPGCQSAGRVQSAALSLICDKELEIDEFKPREYWTVEVQLNKNKESLTDNFPAHLTLLDSRKLNQFSVSSHSEANDAEKKIKAADFHVINSKRNKMRKNPVTPYITSTLQQDAANKLHFSATHTMRIAQKLYEGVELSDGKAVGLITYIRTDGLHISNEAVADIRSLIAQRYGKNFTTESVRKYFKKVKNAQEAHEAIRPTNINRLPSMLVGVLDEESLKLYTLIWLRTVACQMEPAVLEQIQVDIGNVDESIVFRSSCSRVDFPGYQAVFEDSEAEAIWGKENDGKDHNETLRILSSLKLGDPVLLAELELKQHHTQPPPRYSEASMVKKLEELGIGRPSTYAAILKVLQDRNYVTMKGRVLHPEFRGRMVSAFLSHYFSEVTDYSFTADMETELDNVSAGVTEWKGLLRDYWTRFNKYCERATSVHIHQVEKMLEKRFGDYIFASLPDQSRVCPSCTDGTLIFKVSRFGAGYFIGCDQHPKCKYIAKTLYGDEEEDITPQNNIHVQEPKLLGLQPVSNEKVLLKSGPYGSYVQLGEDRKGYSRKRASLSHIKDIGSVTLEDALEMLRYPVTLGDHPKDGKPVILRLGRAGFSVRHGRTMAPVPKNLKPNDVTVEKALELLSSKDATQCGRPKKQKVEEAVEVF